MYSSMVGEIFQEILPSLSLAALLVCLVTTVFILVPCSDEVGTKGRSSSTADSVDKEELYWRKHRNLRVIRDIGKGGIIALSGLDVLPKVGDNENKELKGSNLESVNAAGDDKDAFSGAAEELEGERVRVGGVQDVRGVLNECSQRPSSLSCQIKEEQESQFAETSVRYNLGDKGDFSEAKREEVSEVLETDKLNICKVSYDEDDEGGLFDDWEGIERTELEKLFDKAVAFVGSKSNADLLDTNVRLQLYGLYRVATEGPCHEPRPMALKVSARAKWNAWRRLGNMNRDIAMEQYMILLSKSIPEWQER